MIKMLINVKAILLTRKTNRIQFQTSKTKTAFKN